MVIGMEITHLLIDSCQLVVPISDQSCSAGGRGQTAVKQCYGFISSVMQSDSQRFPQDTESYGSPVRTNHITHGVL